ncbi:MAG: glycoside hydrolase family 3 C-terminal domain-containing protein [Deltaproteobacteria bacterium]|nr:glycoside hydrolase family 3 C-terminal domain-containing protein [Deltaproteobacteria bacterium]
MRRSLLLAAVFLALPQLARADQHDCQLAIAAVSRALLVGDTALLSACQQAVFNHEISPTVDCIVSTGPQRARAAERRLRKLRPACDDASVAALQLGGACEGAASVAALAACLRAAHHAESERLYGIITSPSPATPGLEVPCAAAALHEINAFAAARVRLLQGCKASTRRLTLAPGTTCAADPRVAALLAARGAAAASRLARACTPTALAAARFGAPCDAADDAGEFAECLFGAAADSADAMIAAEHPDVGFCGEAGPLVERRIDALLAAMTLDEKLSQLHGAGPEALNHTAPVPRLGLPGLVMVDGPRGVGISAGYATAFPVGMARAATWDTTLETQVGEAIGRELRAKGGSVLLAPTINLPRHPRWGRAQETYGEDPYLLGRFGVAFVRGAQQHVIASAKHFAANSIEDTRFAVDVQLDEATLREVYLPHFHAVVRDGQVGSVMSAYNKVNGAYCGENLRLLGDILKGDWRFRGFVESDWILGVHSTLPSLYAGLDIEMPSPVWYGPPLRDAALAGTAPMRLIDDAVRRTLRAQLCFRLDSDPPQVDPSQVGTPEHAALARQVAREAVVLLRNQAGALPLTRATLHSLAVVGPLAAAANLGDLGSSTAVPATTPQSPLDAIRAAAGSIAVTHHPNGAATPQDTAAIAAADAVIVFAGLTYQDEGEGFVAAGDRKSLALPRQQDALIDGVAALSPRVVVVLEGSGPLLMPWLDRVDAVLMAWYPGQEGASAIADLLFGDAAPSGRLPTVFPQAEADLPPFDNTSLVVSYAGLHGYRYLDRSDRAPLFPFGFGLTYTDFTYDDLRVTPAVVAPNGRVHISARVTNVGARAGVAVPQLYVGDANGRPERPLRELKGFQRLALEPGEQRRVSFELPVADLAVWDQSFATWVVPEKRYDVELGASSRDLPLHSGFGVVSE